MKRAKYKIILALTCLCLLPQVASAQRTGEVRGVGNTECGEFLDDMKKGAYEQLYTQWGQGYLSAYNIFSTHKQVKIPHEKTIKAYLEKYCRDNPLHRVLQGVSVLISDLGGYSPKN